MDIKDTIYLKHPNTALFTGFFVFFLVYFSPLAIYGRLPGDGDTWLYLGLFNGYGHQLLHIAGCGAYTVSLFPEHGAYLYGEPSFASGLIFLFFKIFTGNDIIAYYLFLSIAFSLNAIAVCLMAREYGIGNAGAALAGFTFSCSPFLFDNIDNQNTLCFFPGILSMVYFLRFTESKTGSAWVFSALFLCLQIYISGYLFLFTVLALAVLALSRWRRFIQSGGKTPTTALFFMTLTALLIFPYIWLYVIHSHLSGALDLVAYFNIPDQFVMHPSGIFSMTGYGVLFMSILGFILWRGPLRREALVLFIIGFVISTCITFISGAKSMYNPFYYLDHLFHYTLWFRIPYRAYILTVLATALLSGAAFQHIMDGTKAKLRWLLMAIPLIIFAESVRLPCDGKYFSEPMRIGIALKQSMANLQPGNMLQLPSSILSDSGKILTAQQNHGVKLIRNELQREHLYMYYQSLFNRNCINGSNGFIPQSRMQNDEMIRHISDDAVLSALIKRNLIRYIVFHKALLIKESENDILKSLRASEQLNLLSETPDFAIFEVK